jgi:hypothetical protein
MNQNEETTCIPQPRPAPRVFPIAGTSLARLLYKPEFKRTFHAKLKTYNPWAVALYRMGLLPLFGAARTVMLLITKGKKAAPWAILPSDISASGVLFTFSRPGEGLPSV